MIDYGGAPLSITRAHARDAPVCRILQAPSVETDVLPAIAAHHIATRGSARLRQRGAVAILVRALLPDCTAALRWGRWALGRHFWPRSAGHPLLRGTRQLGDESPEGRGCRLSQRRRRGRWRLLRLNLWLRVAGFFLLFSFLFSETLVSILELLHLRTALSWDHVLSFKKCCELGQRVWVLEGLLCDAILMHLSCRSSGGGRWR